MFEKIKKNKISLISLVLICLLIFIYWLMSGDEEQSPTQTSSAGQEIVGQELLAELDRLKSLSQIDASFFDDPVWKSLKNTNVEVVEQPLGRTNPFIRPRP